MKKFNLVLLVLVAALFGSSFVACSNLSSGSSDTGSTPEADASNSEPYVKAIIDANGKKVTFKPCSGCTSVEEVKDQFGYTTYTLGISFEGLPIDFFKDYEDVNDKIRENPLYYNGEYIIFIAPDETDTLFILDTTDTYVSFKPAYSNTESAK